MSLYASIDAVPEPDGSLFFDVAYHCLGKGTRIILDGRTCYPTAKEARGIAGALMQAADLADESAAGEVVGVWLQDQARGANDGADQ